MIYFELDWSYARGSTSFTLSPVIRKLMTIRELYLLHAHDRPPLQTSADRKVAAGRQRTPSSTTSRVPCSTTW